MPSPQRDKIRLAQRAALLLWIAAQVLNASTLPGQPEGLIGAWQPGTEVPPAGGGPARAFAPAAAETLDSELLGSAAKPASPIEVWPNARPWGLHPPPEQRSDPLRAVEPRGGDPSAARIDFTDGRAYEVRFHPGTPAEWKRAGR